MLHLKHCRTLTWIWQRRSQPLTNEEPTTAISNIDGSEQLCANYNSGLARCAELDISTKKITKWHQRAPAAQNNFVLDRIVSLLRCRQYRWISADTSARRGLLSTYGCWHGLGWSIQCIRILRNMPAVFAKSLNEKREKALCHWRISFELVANFASQKRKW